MSAFDSDYESGEDGGDRSAGISLGDNGFASDNNYGNRCVSLIYLRTCARLSSIGVIPSIKSALPGVHA